VTPPPVVKPPTPTTHVRHECEDGDEPRVDTREADFELYLLWAAQWAVDGPFQFSQDDVDKALEGFKNFKTIADIAGFVQGFAGAGGAAAVGDIDVGSVLNILTTGADRASEYFDQPSWTDPSGAAGWGVEKALDVLINKMRPKRLLGDWSVTVPLVKVHATCTRTFECRGNRWVLTEHHFDLAYGELVRMGHGGPENNGDGDRPERGAREARTRLRRTFIRDNAKAMAAIKKIVADCART